MRGHPIDRLLDVVGSAVEQFFDLQTTLMFRSCSPGLGRRYGPRRAGLLWQRIKPSVPRFMQLRNLSVGALKLYYATLGGLVQRSKMRAVAAERACREGRVDILRWACGSSGHCSVDTTRLFRIACGASHLPVAKWLVARLPGEQFSPFDLMRSLAVANDVEFAQWILEMGAQTVNAYTPTNLELFTEACEHDNYSFAIWVLTRYPLDFSSVLPVLLEHLASVAPRAMRWVIETFDLDWSDVGSSDSTICGFLIEMGMHTKDLDWYLGWIRRTAPPAVVAKLFPAM